MSAFPVAPKVVLRLQSRVEDDLAAQFTAAGKNPALARGFFARLGLAGTRAKANVGQTFAEILAADEATSKAKATKSKSSLVRKIRKGRGGSALIGELGAPSAAQIRRPTLG